MKIQKIKNAYSLIKIILNTLSSSHKKKYFLIQFFILIASILETLSIFSIIPFLNSISEKNNSSFFWGYNFNSTEFLLLFIILFILSNFFLIFVHRKIVIFSFDITFDLQKNLFNKFLNQNYSYFLKKDLSYFNNMILHETWRFKSSFIESYLFIFSKILFVLFSLIGLTIYNYKITLFFLILLVIFYLSYLFFLGKKFFLISKLNSDLKIKTIQYLNDIFAIIKSLIFKKNKRTIEIKLQEILKDSYKINSFEQIFKGILKNLFEIYFLLIIFIVLLLTKSSLSYDKIISVGVFILVGYKLIPSMHTIYTNFLSLISGYNSLKLIAYELDDFVKSKINLENREIISLKKLSLNNIFFGYEDKKIIINDLNFSVNSNSMIGICGKSGSGKTTFIDILSGLLIPNSGKILINDKELSNAQKFLIENSSFCSQKTFLIDDTVQNNITLENNNDQFNEKLFNLCTEVACVDEFIKKLESGKNTIIGQNGIRVSGGEAQRINIARTLYLNRKIIFLDESLNNLDKLTAEKIIINLKKNFSKKIIIFISHDLNLLRQFDEVLVFESGKIKEQGNFEYLSTNGDYFKKLLNSQYD